VLQKDPVQIVGSLIKQLCRKGDTIPDWLLKFKRDSLSLSDTIKQASFISLAETFEEVFLVIDALDECPKTERHEIIGFINKVVTGLPRAKVFVTSRREEDIVTAFEDGTHTIQIKTENVTADVELYVRSEVKKLRKGENGKKLYLSSDALEGKIIRELTEKAEGM
jgi:ankyrin repeat domain-containing protein 50